MSVAALAGETMQALVDGRVAATVPLSDRGFAYGDGLFETVRIHDGKPVWWDAHLERLQRGCGVLGLDMPARALLQHECALLFPPGSHGVLRLALTRGDGPRGYLAPGSAARRVLQRAALPLPLPVALRLGWARLRLAIQPRLAGIKHLNRLEQVLAARECAQGGFDECLLLDGADAVTCAVSANLFVVLDGQLHTPVLDRCGVAGTCRGWVLGAAAVREGHLQRAHVEQATELFLCNSVRGILPVGRLGDRELPVGPVTRALVRQLGQQVPAFKAEEAMDKRSGGTQGGING